MISGGNHANIRWLSHVWNRFWSEKSCQRDPVRALVQN